MKFRLRLLFPAFSFWLLTSGCGAGFSPKFDVAFSVTENDPVFIEKAVYDESWVGHAGIMRCCWKEARALNVIIPPRPVPKKLFIRWFNYRQQKFYEATAFLPENTSKIMRTMPPTEFSKAYYLTTGVLPSGEVIVWVSNGLDENTGKWIEVARAKGKQVPGNPNDYRTQTEEMTKRGEI